MQAEILYTRSDKVSSALSSVRADAIRITEQVVENGAFRFLLLAYNHMQTFLVTEKQDH